MDFGWFSILPPIIAIVLALITGEVLLSLFVAVFVGATILVGGNPLLGFTNTLDTHIIGSLTDSWNIGILIFCLSIGGLIGVLSKNGGTKGIANVIVSKAKDSRSTLMATWAMGLVIFFDDYANSLIVGNTMRSITDKMRVPREKLAYIVDSTAAPVSSIALISTWVGFETGLIQTSLEEIGSDLSAYSVFLETIPFRFYSLLALFFVVVIILTKRDFGPMAKAERRAKETGKLLGDGATPMVSDEINSMDSETDKCRWYNAIVPIIAVIGITLIGLYINGGGLEGKSFRDAFGDADASVVLLWSSFGGLIVAALMTLAQRILSIKEIMEAWVSGVKSMTVAALILVLAWTLGSVNKELGTAQFIVDLLQGNVPAFLLPVMMFIVPCIVAFSTGSSWGANSIVMPLAIPLAVSIGGPEFLVPVIGAVLTGAVFGDHCSPVSDTTIMSSMASACDHIAHVKTQTPYALVVAGVSIAVGFIPAGLGLHPIISLLLGMVTLVAIVMIFGVKAGETRKGLFNR